MVNKRFPRRGLSLRVGTCHRPVGSSRTPQGAGGLPRVYRRNQVSGNTAGSIGLLPLQTDTAGRSLMLSGQTAANRAHLRFHSGRNAAMAFADAPTAPEYVIPPHLFQVLLLERLPLPLPITEATCSGLRGPVGSWRNPQSGVHQVGRVRKRAAPVERTLPRVFREAGARVRFNALLRDMNMEVAASDARRIEVLAQDLPCFGRSQLAVDVTLRSALGCSGEPQQGAGGVQPVPARLW